MNRIVNYYKRREMSKDWQSALAAKEMAKGNITNPNSVPDTKTAAREEVIFVREEASLRSLTSVRNIEIQNIKDELRLLQNLPNYPVTPLV